MNAFVRFNGPREPHVEAGRQPNETGDNIRVHPAKRSTSEDIANSDRNRGHLKPPASRAAQARDFRAALHLLEKASSGVDNLSKKLQKTEAQKVTLAEEMERYKQMERQWLTDMESANSRFYELESELSSLAERLIAETSRSNDFEAKLAYAEESLKAAEQRNIELETNCVVLHDSILSAFGADSNAYLALHLAEKLK